MKRVLELAERFGKMETIPVEHAERLIKHLEGAPTVALEMIVLARVKFCWLIAKRILKDRGVAVA